MKITLLKDIKSPFIEWKTLKKGLTLDINDEIGRKLIGDKKAEAANKEEILKQKAKEEAQVKNAMEGNKESEKR